MLFFCHLNAVKPVLNEKPINEDLFQKQSKNLTQFQKLSTKDFDNYLNSFLNDNHLNSLSQVSKANRESTKETLLLRKKYKTAILTNNIEIIKEMLSTKTGSTIIIEKTKNNQENKSLWNLAIKKNDFKTLKQMKKIGIDMKLSDYEIIKIIRMFPSVDYYETFEFLFDYIT